MCVCTRTDAALEVLHKLRGEQRFAACHFILHFAGFRLKQVGNRLLMTGGQDPGLWCVLRVGCGAGVIGSVPRVGLPVQP